ncbi:hypothetical protein FJT64_011333 [Amphibalanus amphitrite]|uniref:Gustatory receptor n=1 Tax=Amphibalanus amphitrite TaxID=1232801 RepID=A0A6A4V2C8_AMPAM|nr:hypothetical protein FJT64_011333 [Amphibalanus amphitrite]
MKPKGAFVAELQDSPPADCPVSDEVESALRGSVASRALLRLLKAGALTMIAGRADRVYAAGVFALVTAGVAYNASSQLLLAVHQAGESGVVVMASQTNMFGMIEVILWAASLACLCGGRRRYGRLLVTLERHLSPLLGRPGYQSPARQLRTEVNWVLAVFVALTLFTAGTVINSIASSWGGKTFESLSISTTGIVAFDSSYFLYTTHFYTVPLKFVFAGVYVISGFRFINRNLRTAIDSAQSSQLTSDVLQQLLSLHDDLSKAFTALTDSMYYELLICMIYGTVSNITMWLLLILLIPSGALAQEAAMILQYVVGAAVTVVLPCELTQRVLSAVGETRDLLLTAERRRPQLSQPLRLFRETVGRDLDTLGELGLFRLRRSTLLSITATILTYIIVMVQFYAAPGAEVACPAANATAPTGS